MKHCGTSKRVVWLAAAVLTCGLAGGCASCARDQYLASQRATIRAAQVEQGSGGLESALAGHAADEP